MKTLIISILLASFVSFSANAKLIDTICKAENAPINMKVKILRFNKDMSEIVVNMSGKVITGTYFESMKNGRLRRYEWEYEGYSIYLSTMYGLKNPKAIGVAHIALVTIDNEVLSADHYYCKQDK